MKKVAKSNENQLISPKEAADMIQVGYSTVQRWIDAGKVPAHKTLGGHRRIMKKDLIHFAESKNMPIYGEPEIKETASVLIVDDDYNMLDIISEFIKSSFADTTVLTADNAFKAGILVEKNKPNLIFLDILMPGVSGVEFCQMVKSNASTKDIEIVGITAARNEKLQNEFKEAGASEILLKPIRRKMIESVIDQMFLKKQLQ